MKLDQKVKELLSLKRKIARLEKLIKKAQEEQLAVKPRIDALEVELYGAGK